MVQEIRQIVLDKDELLSALEAHRRMTPTFLPPGKIIDYAVIGYEAIQVAVVSASGAQEKIMIDQHKLLNPVIRFCIENNIMLPRNGRKSISIGDKNISLFIKLDIETYYMANENDILRMAYAFAH